MIPTFAPFCGNPKCLCSQPNPEPCDSYDPAEDSAGVERCGCCGWPLADHSKQVILAELEIYKGQCARQQEELAALRQPRHTLLITRGAQ